MRSLLLISAISVVLLGLLGWTRQDSRPELAEDGVSDDEYTLFVG